MTIPNSNLGMNNIRDEYGGDRPDSVSEYYRNGAYVKNWAASQNIPTDGTIAWSSFRGQAANAGLDANQIQEYIWNNKASLWRAFQRGYSGPRTVGGQVTTYNYNPHPRAEPGGNLTYFLNSQGTINGVADFTSAQSLVYLGPTTTFVYLANAYGYGNTNLSIRAYDKNNNEVPLDEIYRGHNDGARGEVRLLRCNTTDYTSFGYVVIAGTTRSSGYPSFGSIFMLPGAYDLWSSEVVPVRSPATSPTYVTITNPPRGFTVLVGGGLDYDNYNPWFLNNTSINASGNPTPTESASRKYIKFNVWWYGNITAAMLIGTGDYEDTTWKHRIGTTVFSPFATANQAWRLSKFYRVGD